jgi:NADPH-dependent ferric siderophore reductase
LYSVGLYGCRVARLDGWTVVRLYGYTVVSEPLIDRSILFLDRSAIPAVARLLQLLTHFESAILRCQFCQN